MPHPGTCAAAGRLACSFSSVHISTSTFGTFFSNPSQPSTSFPATTTPCCRVRATDSVSHHLCDPIATSSGAHGLKTASPASHATRRELHWPELLDIGFGLRFGSIPPRDPICRDATSYSQRPALPHTTRHRTTQHLRLHPQQQARRRDNPESWEDGRCPKTQRRTLSVAFPSSFSEVTIAYCLTVAIAAVSRRPPCGLSSNTTALLPATVNTPIRALRSSNPRKSPPFRPTCLVRPPAACRV